ncbi:unnamed protein product [Paramecium sonneborni]|uniref:Transmembrane protein n=1 Tax=Paramecium sonneborni TaxID=65129 RepID=A0A8S1PDU2_9CILI|nr:unnamed protein product [Paramecium sonneborni]
MELNTLQIFSVYKTSEQECTHYIVSNSSNKLFICKKSSMNKFPILHIDSFLNICQKIIYSTPVNQLESMFTLAINLKSQLINSRTSRDIRQIIYQRIIPIKFIFTYLFQELTNPYYIFQYFSTFKFAYGQLKVSRQNIFTSIDICIKNLIITIRSQGWDLVGGDFFYIHDNQQLNCDSILLSGVNLYMFLNNQQKNQQMNQHITHYLKIQINIAYISHTKVIQISQIQQNIALVIRTGYSSVRVQRFRNVIFPPTSSKQLYLQTCKFLVILGLIGLSIFTLLYTLQQYKDYSRNLIIIRQNNLNIRYQNVFHQDYLLLNYFYNKLKKEDIIGSNPIKTEEAEKIVTLCFNKTGTLSTLGLQVNNYYHHCDEIFDIMLVVIIKLNE